MDKAVEYCGCRDIWSPQYGVYQAQPRYHLRRQMYMFWQNL